MCPFSYRAGNRFDRDGDVFGILGFLVGEGRIVEYMKGGVLDAFFSPWSHASGRFGTFCAP